VTNDGPRLLAADLGPGVEGWFTGAADRPDPGVGRAGNLSHHRPHVPAELARDRATVGEATSTDPSAWHLMVQVHGREVGRVEPDTPGGTELRDVDGLVTAVDGRVLAAASADCVPVLLAGPNGVAAVHAGRRGVAVGVVQAALAALGGAERAAVGPAIGGCCYEVPAAMRDELAAEHPVAGATTTWGTPSLDLPAAVLDELARAGVSAERVGGCTRCVPGWFSHRADPGAGRQLALVTRR
jgi:hypothetical protein